MRRLFAAAIAAAITVGASAAPAAAEDDPDFISIAGGWYDFNRQKDEGGEFRIEYRSDYKLWVFKPFASFGATTQGQTFTGGGLLIDVYFGRRWVMTPSISANYYTGENSKQDLGYPLEFRSQLEVAYRFDDRSRLGVALSHYSNAGLGDENPGTETASVYYSFPADSVFDWLD
jgi:lipid A 3-O-deacylase